MVAHKSLQTKVFVFWRVVTRSGRTWSNGSSIFLRTLHIVFHRSKPLSDITTKSEWGFPFHHILMNIFIVFSHCCFDLCFPDTKC